MSISGRTQMTNLIPEIWSEKLYTSLKANLVLANLFSRDYENEISQKGDSVNVAQLSAISGERITDDTQAFTTSPVTVTTQQIVADSIFSAAVQVTDVAKLQSIAYETELQNTLVHAIQKALEDYIITLMVPSASAPDHQINCASSGLLAAADVAGMRYLLSAQSVPMSDRYLVVDPNFYGDLLGQANFVSNDYIPANSASSTGMITNPLYGFGVQESSNMAVTTGYAFHKSALAVVLQRGVNIEVASTLSNNRYGMIIAANIIGGAKLMDSKRIVKISA
jgi:hypothetical protein